MPETEVLTAAEQAAADFDRFDALLDPQPEPEPTPEPEPEPEPAPAAAPRAAKLTPPMEAVEPAKIDGRTREAKRRSIQAEIDADTARKHAAKQEADAEETRLTTLRAEAARLAAPKIEAPPPAPRQSAFARYAALPDAPKIENYKTIEEYQFDVSEFVADKRFAENLQRSQHAQHVQQSSAKLATRLQAETAKDATFQSRFDATPVDTRMIPYLHSHPQGEDIMVYLVNNPQAAQRLTTLNLNPRSDLPSVQQIEAIGEIVAALRTASAAASSGPASKSLPISRAKPLIKPVSAAPDASDDDDVDEESLTTEEFIRRGNAKDPRLLRRRR